MRIQAVRGAVGIGENSEDAIISGTEKLMKELLGKNCMEEENIVSVQFTVTGDLTAANPATVFRRLGFGETPLFCSLEPPFEGAMERIVRVLLTAYTDEEGELVPVYIQGAEKLRPDITGKASDGPK
ncbi:MAG: chorismate mutase [Spirochaetaceae bacterium]